LAYLEAIAVGGISLLVKAALPEQRWLACNDSCGAQNASLCNSGSVQIPPSGDERLQCHRAGAPPEARSATCRAAQGGSCRSRSATLNHSNRPGATPAVPAQACGRPKFQPHAPARSPIGGNISSATLLCRNWSWMCGSFPCKSFARDFSPS